MKNTDQNAIEIAKRGGAIPSSDWTSGTGNFVSKRAIPQLCIEVSSSDLDKLPPKSRRAAAKVLRSRPRVQKFIAVNDWKTVNKLMATT